MPRTFNLVSAVIPCYNHGEYIEEAIDSITAQTYRGDIEIIVVDDGSDEHSTRELLENLDKPNTTVYRKKNGGPSTARNYGIEKSRGEFILTLDSDDRFKPSFVEKAFDVLNNDPKVGMVTSYVKRTGNKSTSFCELKGGGIEKFLIKNNASASLLFRKRCWEETGGYDENVPGFEDWEFFINVTKRGWSVESIPEYLFLYREIEGSRFDNDLKKRPEILKYFAEKHNDVYQKHIVNVIYEKENFIRELREQVNVLRYSKSQKIGNLFMKPIRYLKNNAS